MCVLTGMMLLLSALVVVQAVRSWYGLLTRPEPEAKWNWSASTECHGLLVTPMPRGTAKIKPLRLARALRDLPPD